MNWFLDRIIGYIELPSAQVVWGQVKLTCPKGKILKFELQEKIATQRDLHEINNLCLLKGDKKSLIPQTQRKQ